MIKMNATSSTNEPPFPWLVADIGGSNARFGWVTDSGNEIRYVKTLPVADFATPVDASRNYLESLSAELGSAFSAPRCAAFAVATAVGQDQINFTNSHWSYSQAQVKEALKLETFLTLNDFEALALSLPRLKAHQIKPHAAQPQQIGTLAVIGPGTGLGVGSVIQSKHGWIAIPGEGGHATLAPTDEFEARILDAVRDELPHVSAERLLSGIGLPTLYRAVARCTEASAEPLTTEQIVERGLQNSCVICRKTLDAFCAFLGSFAGSVALIVGARSGVYIGGGIVPRLGDFFFQSRFREKFEAKGRLHPYVSQIPTALITDTLAALSGAALAIEQYEG